MKALDRHNEDRIKGLFRLAAFVRHLGIQLDGMGPGWCEASLEVGDQHLQQDGFVHAGVVSTLADHTGGGAGWTCTVEGQTVLTVEFKISFLRPAKAHRLRCRSEVLRAGRSLIYTESTVYATHGGGEKQVAKLSQTLAVVDAAVGQAAPGERIFQGTPERPLRPGGDPSTT
ncbi:MAG: PaaI family thioesterase [Deferrisomatales bacterium]|nr:PaaI family thioesterase [Deferrisomatales bacterium]